MFTDSEDHSFGKIDQAGAYPSCPDSLEKVQGEAQAQAPLEGTPGQW